VRSVDKGLEGDENRKAPRLEMALISYTPLVFSLLLFLMSGPFNAVSISFDDDIDGTTKEDGPSDAERQAALLWSSVLKGLYFITVILQFSQLWRGTLKCEVTRKNDQTITRPMVFPITRMTDAVSDTILTQSREMAFDARFISILRGRLRAHNKCASIELYCECVSAILVTVNATLGVAAQDGRGYVKYIIAMYYVVAVWIFGICYLRTMEAKRVSSKLTAVDEAQKEYDDLQVLHRDEANRVPFQQFLYQNPELTPTERSQRAVHYRRFAGRRDAAIALNKTKQGDALFQTMLLDFGSSIREQDSRQDFREFLQDKDGGAATRNAPPSDGDLSDGEPRVSNVEQLELHFGAGEHMQAGIEDFCARLMDISVVSKRYESAVSEFSHTVEITEETCDEFFEFLQELPLTEEQQQNFDCRYRRVYRAVEPSNALNLHNTTAPQHAGSL
jgi:hypothetical protein